MAKLPSQNPAATRLREAAKAARAAEDRKDAMASAALQRGAIERGNREQARESIMPKRAKGGKVMKHASKAGNAMKKKSADTMGRAMKKYAKGGSVDGCATKGKTKGKMVKMAMGGMAGYKRGGKTC